MADAGGAAGAWAKAKPAKTRPITKVVFRIDPLKELSFKIVSVV
jgi:hypothetical protein